jgi:cardiolipin synthase (CMP-forming)
MALCSEGMRINRRQGEDRLLTVPNALTALRLACVPVFLLLLAQPHHEGQLAAAFLLASLGVTDGLDGYVARHFNQVTSLGKLADPLVDRVLILSATIGALVVGAVPGWLVALVLTREVLVIAGAGVLASVGARRLDVSWAGKAGTFGLMFALPLFLMGGAPFRWSGTAEALAWVAAIGGLGLGWFAFAGYVPRARAAFVEARAGRKTGGVVGPSPEAQVRGPQL